MPTICRVVGFPQLLVLKLPVTCVLRWWKFVFSELVASTVRETCIAQIVLSVRHGVKTAKHVVEICSPLVLLCLSSFPRNSHGVTFNDRLEYRWGKIIRDFRQINSYMLEMMQDYSRLCKTVNYRTLNKNSTLNRNSCVFVFLCLSCMFGRITQNVSWKGF